MSTVTGQGGLYLKLRINKGPALKKNDKETENRTVCL